MTEAERAEEVLKNMTETRLGDNFFGNMSGYEFSIFMQKLLVSENGYVIDTGNWENVNYAIAYKLLSKIKKHPLLWKMFMVG